MDNLPALIRAGRERLIARLKAADCNISALARESGVASKTLYRIRDGENVPELDTIEKVLDAFGRMGVAPPAVADPDGEGPVTPVALGTNVRPERDMVQG